MKKAKHPIKRSSSNPATDAPGAKTAAGDDAVQGEGNYTAAREFNDAQRRFVQSGKAAAAAGAAAPKTDSERDEMLAAEQEGKRRAKEDYPPPPDATPGRGPATAREPAKDAPRRPG